MVFPATRGNGATIHDPIQLSDTFSFEYRWLANLFDGTNVLGQFNMNGSPEQGAYLQHEGKLYTVVSMYLTPSAMVPTVMVEEVEQS